MSTSKHTISQVKDILRKLDRSIDDAREKRLRPAPAAGPHAAHPAAPARSTLAGPSPFGRP